MAETEPVIDSKFGIFKYSWPSLGLDVTVDHLHESHDTISCETTFCNAGGDVLHIARLNLFSTQGKSGLARHLHAQINNLNWDSLIELVATETIKRYRVGEPPIKVGQLHSRTAPKWRIQFIIPEGQTAVLFGPGESNKTNIALAAAISIQHGINLLGLSATQGNVLYCDWESSDQEINDRLLAMEAGMELDFHPDILYQHYSSPIVNFLPELQKLVSARNISTLIIDSAVEAAGGEKEAKVNAGPTLQGLRSLGTSNLVLAHHAKNQEGKKSPFGSVFWINTPRHVVEVRTSGEFDENSDTMELGLFRYKSNEIRKMPILGYSVVWNDLGIQFRKTDINELPTLQEHLSLKSRILVYLKHGPASYKDIISELSIPKTKTEYLSTLLTKMRHGNLILNLPGGVWALKSNEDNLC